MSYLEHSQQPNPSSQHQKQHSQQQQQQQQQTSQSQSSYPQQMNNIFSNQPFQRSQQPLSNLTSPPALQPQQQSQPIPPQQLTTRSRGDSIFLPPPISSSQIRPTSEQSYETTTANPRLNQSSGNPLGSRSNSIFSSLINLPGSNGNSISEQSGVSSQQPQAAAASAGGSNNKIVSTGNQAPNLPPTSRSRQISLVPNQEFTIEDLENLFGNNKESMANLFAWQQGDLKFSLSGASGGPAGNNSTAGAGAAVAGTVSAPAPNAGTNAKGKSGSLDLSAWMDNSNQAGSIGFNNSITEIIQNMISNGSIDFSNMNNQQRRDSILKIINNQTSSRNPRVSISSANSSNASANLRSDIFEKGKEKSSTKQSIDGGNKGRSRQGKRSKSKSEKELSPTSSVSSKASKRNDEPQSPKTSPNLYNTNRISDASSYPPTAYNQRPSANSSSQNVFQTSANPMSPSNQYQYSTFPSFNNSLSFQAMSPGGNRQNSFMGGYQYPLQNQQQQIQGQMPPQQMYSQVSRPQVQPYQQPYLQQQQPQQQQQPPPQQQSQYYMPQSQQYPPQPQYQQQQQQLQQQIQESGSSKKRKQPAKRTRQTKDAVDSVNPQAVSPVNPNLIPAQQIARSEDGRPLLGATKIDQLMLVIQARDKGVTKSIDQGPDGSVLAARGGYGPGSQPAQSEIVPRPVTLVGGVDKPQKHKSDSSHEEGEDEHDSKRHKARTQQCPYCLKYFTQSTHLEVHIRSHIGYKPYECTYCHKKFTQGGNLRTHLRLHTGEKPFTCDICNRSFNRKGNLEAHRLTHENVKPFECKLDNCDKSFTQLGNLKSHQNRFHSHTLNTLTHKLAELSGPALERLPPDEKNLLLYFKSLYKNSNKGIRGRGKQQKEGSEGSLASPEATVS
ncbi:AZF1 [Candida margitis]|uniref:AZF1 n=1 Tax=Candida margitis TaxID=1775924 RepID=UPI002226534D|nr:AZF1 [Candida margitis]KAI5967719.1 AZF1 [Candida margitis]